MQHLLRIIATLVGSRPGLALLGLLGVTAMFGVLATGLSSESDLTAFSPSTERALALDDIQAAFGGQGEVFQVIVVAGDGDLLSADRLRFGQRVAEAVRERGGEHVVGEVHSYAGAFAQAIDLEAADDAAVKGGAPDVLSNGGRALLSRDADAEAATASAGLVLAVLDPALENQELLDVGREVRAAVEALPAPAGVEVIPFSAMLLNASLEEGMSADLPRLLGLSLVLVLAILAYTYRSFTDLVLGFVGLIVTIAWTYGLAALLGPGYLGVTGPLSQISTIVPVLLVGLGIDYAIHLTGRYREQQRRGASAASASATAVMTVGGALVLATATTVVGFLTNVASPLPPVTDFGIFTAAGVISAFVVFLVLIPSVRHLLDRRKETPDDAEDPDESQRALGDADVIGLARLMQRAALLSEHTPRLVIGVAGLVTLAAVGAATQVETTFSQEDFIPEGSFADRALGALDEHFGGDLSERSYILVRADATEPAVANALLEAETVVGQSDLVRPGQSGGPEVSSAPSVAVRVLGDAAAEYGWDGTRFAADADLAGLYQAAREADPAAMGALLAEDIALVSAATTGGQDGADAVRADLEPGASVIREAGATAVVTSQPLVMDEIVDALTASQVRGIAITLVAAAGLLVGYYWYVGRQPLLGLITMTPSALVTAWIIGSMWALGLSFNVLTAMVAALAIGIGVPYGIHITHRFRQEWDGARDIDAAIREVVTHTGGALLGSAATTAAGFGTLALSSLVPIRQFGMITALSIIYALVSATLVQPALLKLWAGRRRDGRPPRPEAGQR